jgi:RHS repeat-associated protein
MDAPVAILDSRFNDARVIHYNWRGLAESSSFTDGSPADCELTGGTCTRIAWNAGEGVYFKRSTDPYAGMIPVWIGSLPANGKGDAGLLYRRNRFFDPASGRFTQQDPIGLGGGLNLYGFGGGDPLTFSDPFGLCPPCYPGMAGIPFPEPVKTTTDVSVSFTNITATTSCSLVRLTCSGSFTTFPQVGVSLDVTVTAVEPQESSPSGSVDVGLGRHGGISLNVAADKKAPVNGFTLHFGFASPTPTVTGTVNQPNALTQGKYAPADFMCAKGGICPVHK